MEKENLEWAQIALLGNSHHYKIKGTEIDKQLVEAFLIEKDVNKTKELIEKGADINVILEYRLNNDSIKRGNLLYHILTEEPYKPHLQSSNGVGYADREMQARADRNLRLKNNRIRQETAEKNEVLSKKTINMFNYWLSLGNDKTEDAFIKMSENQDQIKLPQVAEYFEKVVSVHNAIMDLGEELKADEVYYMNLASNRDVALKNNSSIDEIKDKLKKAYLEFKQETKQEVDIITAFANGEVKLKDLDEKAFASQEDYDKVLKIIQDRLYNHFSDKLNSAETEEKKEEIKKALDKRISSTCEELASRRANYLKTTTAETEKEIEDYEI